MSLVEYLNFFSFSNISLSLFIKKLCATVALFHTLSLLYFVRNIINMSSIEPQKNPSIYTLALL